MISVMCRHLLALALLVVVVPACAPRHEAGASRPLDAPLARRAGEGPPNAPGIDVTDEYIVDGEDVRVSPHGKTRSSVPDQVMLCSVTYVGHSTGTVSNYQLEVDFEDGEPVRINFPSGGWRHVYPEKTADGWVCSDDSATYTIERPIGVD